MLNCLNFKNVFMICVDGSAFVSFRSRRSFFSDLSSGFLFIEPCEYDVPSSLYSFVEDNDVLFSLFDERYHLMCDSIFCEVGGLFFFFYEDVC